MAKFMHQEVLRVTRATMQATHYTAFTCDEVSIMDNQTWLSVHCCVMHNWVRIPICISLDKLVKGLSIDNLIKVIVEAFMINGDLPKYQIAQKFICFGANGVNVF
jgi:hypothetical protein